jgi:hypothetical protein
MKEKATDLALAYFGPTPEATAEQPRPRPAIMAGSFAILVAGQLGGRFRNVERVTAPCSRG